MSLAALGCNPNEAMPATDWQKRVGVDLGTIAYSNDGGMYVAVQADGAITRYDACSLESRFQIDQATTGTVSGATIVIPQVAMSDNDYGWALVAGRGRVRVDAAAISAAGGQFAMSIGGNGQLENRGNAHIVSGIMAPADAGTAARDVECFAMWPKKIN